VPPDGGLGGQLPGIEQGFPGPQGIPGAEGFQPPAFPGAEQAAGLGPPPIDPFSAAAGSSSAVPGGAAAGAGAATHGGIGIIKVIVIAVAATGGVALGGAIVGGILIFTGDPQACSNREIDISRAVSNDVDAAWNAFVVEASQEGSASITLTEDEVTSRGFFYLEDEGVPFDDLQLYFCDDGAAEAKGRLSLPGPDANVVVRGSLDISGDKPRIEIEEVRAGNLPGGIATPAVNAIIDSGVLELDLDIELTDVDFREGEIELEGEG
jgi:hypothetical protein